METSLSKPLVFSLPFVFAIYFVGHFSSAFYFYNMKKLTEVDEIPALALEGKTIPNQSFR